MKYIAIFLVLLCCFMGAASAAEDVSTDLADLDSVDSAVALDSVSEDASDSVQTEPITDSSDDTTEEQIINDTNDVEQTDDSANVGSEPTRSTEVDAEDWDEFYTYATATDDDYTIQLTGTSYTISQAVTLKNSITVIGTSTCYFTGGSNGATYFTSTGDLSITFINVTFKDINAGILFRLATGTGTNKFINCSFDNIYTSVYKSSVIWNDKGYMNISGCNFTNCNDGFGVITNYATTGSVQMNVENSRFEDNYGRLEPGAINNCGEMNVTNSTFTHNVAGWWAGAVHTHTNAYTRIVDSTFADNLAGGNSGSGWNGGALFSYSKLEVINSVFTGNNVSVLTGGGAIFGYSMGTSTYNITVDSCNFTQNVNKHTSGYAGAIGVQNIGYLTISNSRFVNNSATIGQAIAAITKDEPYCMNCTNCSCPNCPNCTNCSHDVSSGYPTTKIYNNTFVNHTGSGDTVYIAGNHYLFANNTFINSTQTTHYDGSGNQYGLTSLTSMIYAENGLNSKMLQSPILSADPVTHDVIYVNSSSSNKPEKNGCDGQSWETAYGTLTGFNKAMSNINTNGIIYLADVTFKSISQASQKNVTVIGLNREKTIVSSSSVNLDGYSNYHYQCTFINITFNITEFNIEKDYEFINCTFINSNVSLWDQAYSMYLGAPENIGLDYSFYSNFTGCNFVNSTFNAYRFGEANFKDCTFENITADFIVNNTGGFALNDGIFFSDCKFNNVNVKGIVDVPTGTIVGAEEGSRVRIEYCTGIENSGMVSEGDRDFINTTPPRPKTTLVCDINSENNFVVTLKDSEDNPVSGPISITINDGEIIPYEVENGAFTIPLDDLIGDLTGKVAIKVNFADSDLIIGSCDELNTLVVVKTVTETVVQNVTVEVPVAIDPAATTIDANALTATAKVAKTLSVTLKDASGKAIANKTITYSINGVAKTATTDVNGIVKIAVNQANAGTYYYYISFLGDNDYKASFKTVKVTVNKQATKAVFKKKTFKVKAKTKKVSFTLKDASGKAIKGKKITVKVGKKTYTAKTNAKGVATVKVKLTKKGKYAATAKFAGDSTYKAVTKKAKITLK